MWGPAIFNRGKIFTYKAIVYQLFNNRIFLKEN